MKLVFIDLHYRVENLLFAALILITLAAALPAVLASWVKALVAGAMFKLFNLLNFFSHLSSFVFCISSSLTSSAFQSFAFYIFLICRILHFSHLPPSAMGRLYHVQCFACSQCSTLLLGQVFGIWYLTFGIWYLLLGIWYFNIHPLP